MDQNVNTPLVSVLLPVFNSEKYLRSAIRSVLDQSYRHFELIIIDDGSSDRSLQVAESFSDPRIRIHKNEENLGLIASLNLGLKLCKGKYIARMDADDVCLSNRLQAQVEFLERHTDVIACGSDYVTFSETKYKRLSTIREPAAIKAWLMFATPLCHPSVMIRADKFSELDLRYNPEFKHVEDYELWTCAALNGNLANIDQALLLYRDHPQQVSHQKREEQIHNSAKVQRNYLSKLGFVFTEEQLRIHSVISSNQKISSAETLQAAIDWLENLYAQNSKDAIISEEGMRFALARMHYDVCGNTSLGLKAYKLWSSSFLHKHYGNSLKARLRLLAKCVIRRFR